MKKIHKKHAPYKCEICNQSFTQKGNLDTHIKKIHEEFEPFKCEICDKIFKQKGNLEAHSRKIHEKLLIQFLKGFTVLCGASREPSFSLSFLFIDKNCSVAKTWVQQLENACLCGP